MPVHPVHLLLDDLRHGQLHPQVGGHVHGVVDVLQVDGDPGTGGEVSAQELGDLSVHHCALGKAALDGVKKGLRIQPGLFRKGECLSHGAQMDAHHHVVGPLGGAAAAGGPQQSGHVALLHPHGDPFQHFVVAEALMYILKLYISHTLLLLYLPAPFGRVSLLQMQNQQRDQESGDHDDHEHRACLCAGVLHLQE